MMRATETPVTRNDQGVSLILGAMLLTGVALMAFVSYQFSVAPELDAALEAEHSRQVSGQLTTLKATLDQHAANQTTGISATPIDLGRERTSIFSSATVSGSLSYTPEDKPVRVDAKQVLIQQLNSSKRISQPEAWTDVSGGSTPIEDVDEVVNLRVRIDRIARDYQGDHVAVEVRDADGDFAGEFRTCVADHAPDWDLHTVVRDADGAILYNNAQSYFNNQEYAPFWLNALNPDYRFDQVLGVAEKPMELILRVQDDIGETGSCPGDGDAGSGSDTITAEYSITYFQASDGGPILQGSGGLVAEGYNRTFKGGTIAYEATNGNLVDQTFLLENGGLILDQEDGSVFKISPGFDAGLSSNTVVLSMTVPTTQGDTTTVTGSGTGTVFTNARENYLLRAQATNFTINVTTDHPALWTTLWRDELLDAGLGEGTGFDIVNASTWARVDIWGLLDPDPTSDVYDLFVTLRQANVRANVQG